MLSHFEVLGVRAPIYEFWGDTLQPHTALVQWEWRQLNMTYV